MAATLKTIAQELGLSITTVSRALSGYSDVAELTRQQVLDVAKRLNYRPNLTAQRLQKKQTDTLGFIMPTSGPRYGDPFFSEFLAGFGNEASLGGYDLLVSSHAPDSAEESEAYRKAAIGGWLDGVVIVRTRIADERVAILQQSGLPFVSFGRTDSAEEHPYVDEDSGAGIGKLVQHLVDHGHRDIGLIMAPAGLMHGRARRVGFEATMLQNGLNLNPSWMIHGDFTQRGGYDAMVTLLEAEERPTAIVGANDLMAIGAMKAAQNHGLQVPGDVSIVGFDDISTSEFVIPALTTIRQPIYEIAELACRMLIQLVSGQELTDRHILLVPELTIRESSGPASFDERG